MWFGIQSEESFIERLNRIHKINLTQFHLIIRHFEFPILQEMTQF